MKKYLITTGKKNRYFTLDCTTGVLTESKKNNNVIGTIHNKKYLLWIDEINQDWVFQVGVKKFNFCNPNLKIIYYERKYCCYFEIKNCNKTEFKKVYIKSAWELLNISTYDFQEKIEDNYFFDVYNKYIDFINCSKDNQTIEIQNTLKYLNSL